MMLCSDFWVTTELLLEPRHCDDIVYGKEKQGSIVSGSESVADREFEVLCGACVGQTRGAHLLRGKVLAIFHAANLLLSRNIADRWVNADALPPVCGVWCRARCSHA